MDETLLFYTDTLHIHTFSSPVFSFSLPAISSIWFTLKSNNPMVVYNPTTYDIGVTVLRDSSIHIQCLSCLNCVMPWHVLRRVRLFSLLVTLLMKSFEIIMNRLFFPTWSLGRLHTTHHTFLTPSCNKQF